MGLNYREAGVDIAASQQILERIGVHVERCRRPEVLQGLGGFAGLFDLSAMVERYRQPVVAQSIDGVGSKTLLATLASDYRGLGADLFAAVCNDVAVTGAEVLTFLDYIAQGRLSGQAVETVCATLADCCRRNGVALVGGETAEMPGVYQHADAMELVGVAFGVAERSALLGGEAIKVGQRLYGFSSSGLHTNGYSLVRKIFIDRLRVSLDHCYPELGRPLGEVLLAPHHSYLALIKALKQSTTLAGLAHITGGGVVENLPRILPPGLGVQLRRWPTPPLFQLIAELGQIEQGEMHTTFNMGVGLIAVAAADDAELCQQQARAQGLQCWPLGEVVPLSANGGERLQWQ